MGYIGSAINEVGMWWHRPESTASMLRHLIGSKDFWPVVCIGVQAATGTALSELKAELGSLSFKRFMVSSRLYVCKMKINQQEKDEVALRTMMSSKGINPEKAKWKGKNWHQNKEKSKVGDSQEKKKRRDKSQVACYRCLHFGHYQSECHTNLNKNRGGRSNFAVRKEDTETKEEEEEVSLLMAYTSKDKIPVSRYRLQ
ncbi:hypothetical protein T459_20218 [Capsicum annuum]|uniref:CCHC-type domain-containing protein n=1 Tax=Capsicum annuum TaxID=4072 RepID=A0A2G2Z3Y1_CAPAN|nr:hypothetical protein FXO37_34651 [Capsicum annuum]PHT76696.1 hypothetical protein T459_20218 [Capsicum annuum]